MLGERLFKPLFNGCASTGYGRPYYTEATVGLFAGLDLDLWVCIAQRLPPPLARIMPRWQKRSSRAIAGHGRSAALLQYAGSYQMLDLLEQTHDVIDYAVKRTRVKWRTVWKRKCLSTARGTDSGGR